MLTELQKRILDTTKVSKAKWSRATQVGGDPSYRVLFGGAVGLLKSLELIEQASTQSDFGSQDPIGLRQDLAISLSKARTLDWSCTGNLLDWSIGYFVNRAEHSIAAAFDRCLTFWVARILELRVADATTDNIWAFGWPSARLTVLRRFSKARALVDGLCLYFHVESLTSGQKTLADYVDLGNRSKWSRRRIPSQLPKLYDLLPIPAAKCLAIVCDRTNTFKHRTAGLVASRDELTQAINSRVLAWKLELVIGVRAQEYVAALWNAAVDEKAKPPRSGG